MSDLQTQKKVLRQYFLSARRRISDNEYALKSRIISDKVLSLPEIERAHLIHIFWPILKNKEVDTRILINELTLAGKQCVLPRIVSFTDTKPNTRRMVHCLYEGETNLRANRWDVYEPVSTEAVSVASLDTVIVPALAVDIYGFRLGYGKGYYDELLDEATCPTICPIFNSFLNKNLPVESHDRPVNILVTEQTVTRLN